MWVRYLDAIYAKTNQHCRAEKTALLICCYQYGMICHRSSLIRQSCHFERHFDSVLLQLADTLNTQFKYRDGSWHSLLKRVKFLRKTWTIWFVKTYWIQDATACSLEKWTLKFKLLYLLNLKYYFNKICRICGMNPHLIPLQIWWIYLLQFQRYWIFPRGLLFWRALYISDDIAEQLFCYDKFPRSLYSDWRVFRRRREENPDGHQDATGC